MRGGRRAKNGLGRKQNEQVQQLRIETSSGKLTEVARDIPA
jgi:hypothetical protein